MSKHNIKNSSLCYAQAAISILFPIPTLFLLSPVGYIWSKLPYFQPFRPYFLSFLLFIQLRVAKVVATAEVELYRVVCMSKAHYSIIKLQFTKC